MRLCTIKILFSLTLFLRFTAFSIILIIIAIHMGLVLYLDSTLFQMQFSTIEGIDSNLRILSTEVTRTAHTIDALEVRIMERLRTEISSSTQQVERDPEEERALEEYQRSKKLFLDQVYKKKI